MGDEQNQKCRSKFLNCCYLYILYHWNFIQGIFISLYAVEQAGLVYLIHIDKFDRTFTVSVFIVVLLTTFAIQELVLKARMKAYEDKVYELQMLNNELSYQADVLEQDYNNLANRYNKLVQAYNEETS